MGMARIGASFKDVQTIIFGPRGDNYANDLLVMRERLPYLPKIRSAQVSVKELNSGALPALLEITKRILREFPEDIILICPTATSVLLKEDASMVLARLEPEERKRIFFPPVHYFKDDESGSADKTLRFLLEQFSAPAARSPAPSVNIIGSSLFGYNYLHNLNALKLLLMDLDIKVNLVLPLGACVSDLRAAARAWANIISDQTISYSAARYLKDTYNRPFLRHIPYGIYNTGRFIEELGAVTGEDYSVYITAKEKEAAARWKSYLTARDLSKLRVCVFGDLSAALGLAQVMKNDFHCEVAMVGTYDTGRKELFYEQGKELSNNLLASEDSREVWNIIKRQKPDLVMGTLNEERLCSVQKIPFLGISLPSRYIQTSLFPVETFLGYGGFDYLLSCIKKLFP